MKATTTAAVSYSAERYAAKYFAKQPKQRDFVTEPPRPLDRITFNTPDDGMLTGYVSVIRQHLGNGERFAWVELDNEPAGMFRGVPLADILTCDDAGDQRRNTPNSEARRLCLSDYSNRLRREIGQWDPQS
ncbi:hypothetical protein [Herbaspirillum seropedicae]